MIGGFRTRATHEDAPIVLELFGGQTELGVRCFQSFAHAVPFFKIIVRRHILLVFFFQITPCIVAVVFGVNIEVVAFGRGLLQKCGDRVDDSLV